MPSPMPSTTRRRAAVASLLLSPGLAACGFGVQTNQIYQPGEGADETVGAISVLAATIVVEGTETADQGTLSTTIVNDSVSDGVTLDSVEAEDAQVELLAPVEIGPQANLDLSTTGAGLVTGELDPGSYVQMNFVFSDGTEVPLDVIIVNNEGPYAEVTPAEASESPSATPSSSPAEPPATDPSESPSAGPSSNPSPSEGATEGEG